MPKSRISELLAICFCLLPSPSMDAAESRPNILIVTVDDMSADSLGAFGCLLPDTSPSIDAFAKQSLRFQHAHVLVGNCMPGRNIMWSGLYSHINGVEGFVQNTTPDYPVLCDLAKQAGYFAAIRGKVSHSTPYSPYAWDAILDSDASGKKYHVKDAASYGESTREGIKLAGDAGKPFCLMVNISDPHKPFYAEGKGGVTVPDHHVPSKVFEPSEVPVPGFLYDDPVIRKELSHYYSSVRRADDCFAEIMTALDESGQTENTFVLFLSDHGMPLPFAKTQLYYHSTRTPLMVRWPGVTKAGSVDQQHVVSTIDFIPTLLDVMQHSHPTPKRLNGRSFAPLLKGAPQDNRDFAILQYNENSGRNRHPMRGIATTDRLYLYNAWPDGVRKFATATTGTSTYRQMVKLADENPLIASRIELFDHRVVEELYDIENDADCLVNLIDNEKFLADAEALRSQLSESLAGMNDPVAPLVADAANAALREAFMRAEDKRVADAKANRAKQKNTPKRAKPNKQKTSKSSQASVPELMIAIPESARVGDACQVIVQFALVDGLDEQQLHVTMKTASIDNVGKTSQGKRIHREVLTINGAGKRAVDFVLPSDLESKAVSFAAFVGDEFSSSLRHVVSAPVPLAEATVAAPQ